MIMLNLLSGGYRGTVYPINPKADTIFGIPAAPSITSLNEVPDLALIAVPAALVKGLVEECGRKGVRAVVIITAGFSEAGPEGAELEQQIAEVAARYRMALIGPNCMGVMSSWKRLYATGAAVMHPEAGPASFISQSGNMGIQLMASAEDRQGGIGKFVGVGNEALFNTTDFFEYFGRDAETGLILAYVEGFDDGRRFMEVAQRTTVRKPVLVLRAGTSEYGSKAAASHTGTMAGSAKVFEAVVRQSGLIATQDPDEFLDLAFSLSYMPLPAGRRVAVVTMGGGWGVLSADEVSRTGLTLAELPPEVIAEIDQVLPPFWSRRNPVDLVGSTAEGAPERVVETVIRSDAVDAMVVLGVVGVLTAPLRAIDEAQRLAAQGDPREVVPLPEPRQFVEREQRYLEQVGRLLNTYRKPIVNVSFTPLKQAVFEGGGRYSTVVLPSPLRAVRVIARMAEHRCFLDGVAGREGR